MKLEPLATPPEVPEMSPPELNMPKPEIPEAASAPDIAPIKPLAAPLPPMRSIVSVPGRGPHDPRRISETGAGISSGTEGAGPAHTGAAHAPVRQRGYEIGQVDVAPKAVGQSLPAYPRKARRMGIEGWVKVRFLVNKEGGVEHLKILEESPVDIFYKAVMSTVPGWRFRPAQKEGKAVDVWVDQTIKFKMETW
jgi:protein TonB